MEAADLEFLEAIAWVVGGLLLVVTVTGLSRKVGWSAPLVLVAVGVGGSFLPFVPAVELTVMTRAGSSAVPAFLSRGRVL